MFILRASDVIKLETLVIKKVGAQIREAVVLGYGNRRQENSIVKYACGRHI